MKQFDFTYAKVNSLYRNRIAENTNSLDFSVLDKGSSEVGKIGIGKSPSDIVQLQIGNIYLPKKIRELVLSSVDSLIFHRLYVLVNQFNQEYFSSPQGYRYHFEFTLSQDPEDDTQLIAKPVNDKFTFPNPMRFFNQLTFDFFTYKPYIFEENLLEVYADYTAGFLRFYKVDGTPHYLTGYDLVSIQNFEVPGILSKDSSNASTYRDNYYRVNVISATVFEIPVVLEATILNSINRPADQALGYYKPPVVCVANPSVSPTVINTPIPHGLLNGDTVNITAVSDPTLLYIIRAFQVTVLTPTSFSIVYDSSVAVSQFTVTIAEFSRISVNRLNTLYIYIQSKKVEFQMQMKSLSTSAGNYTITVS